MMTRSPCIVEGELAPQLLALVVHLDNAMKAGKLKKLSALEKASSQFLDKMKAKGRLIGRRLKVIRLIEKGGRGPARLMKETPVRRRTFYRDLRAIEEAGFTIELLDDGTYTIC